MFFGEARFTGTDTLVVDGAKLRFKKAMIATGARPDTPSIPGLVEAGYLTNENVFDLTELPRRLLVIGGGPLGCELAQAFCRFGAQIIIAQDMPLFLPKEERDAAQILSDAFARDGIEVRLNTTAVNVRVEDGQKLVDLVSDDYESTVAVDAILTGTGRVPNVEGLGPGSCRRRLRRHGRASGSTISCRPAIGASMPPATSAWSTSSPIPRTRRRASWSRTRCSSVASD